MIKKKGAIMANLTIAQIVKNLLRCEPKMLFKALEKSDFSDIPGIDPLASACLLAAQAKKLAGESSVFVLRFSRDNSVLVVAIDDIFIPGDST